MFISGVNYSHIISHAYFASVKLNKTTGKNIFVVATSVCRHILISNHFENNMPLGHFSVPKISGETTNKSVQILKIASDTVLYKACYDFCLQKCE